MTLTPRAEPGSMEESMDRAQEGYENMLPEAKEDQDRQMDDEARIINEDKNHFWSQIYPYETVEDIKKRFGYEYDLVIEGFRHAYEYAGGESTAAIAYDPSTVEIRKVTDKMELEVLEKKGFKYFFTEDPGEISILVGPKEEEESYESKHDDKNPLSPEQECQAELIRILTYLEHSYKNDAGLIEDLAQPVSKLAQFLSNSTIDENGTESIKKDLGRLVEIRSKIRALHTRSFQEIQSAVGKDAGVQRIKIPNSSACLAIDVTGVDLINLDEHTVHIWLESKDDIDEMQAKLNEILPDWLQRGSVES